MSDILIAVISTGTLASLVSAILTYLIGLRRERGNREKIINEMWSTLNEAMSKRLATLTELVDYQQQKISGYEERIGDLQTEVSANALVLQQTVARLSETEEKLAETKCELDKTKSLLEETKRERNDLKKEREKLEQRVVELERRER